MDTLKPTLNGEYTFIKEWTDPWGRKHAPGTSLNIHYTLAQELHAQGIVGNTPDAAQAAKELEEKVLKILKPKKEKAIDKTELETPEGEKEEDI